jgi:hypothetical protein
MEIIEVRLLTELEKDRAADETDLTEQGRRQGRK